MVGRPSSEAIAAGRIAGVETRRDAILRELASRGVVQLAPLAASLRVSAMTLRRDLDEMEREGLLERIRGGAVRPQGAAPVIVDTDEPEFQKRMDRALTAKEAIAAEADRLLAEVRTLAIDVGTTTLCLARRLGETRQAKVFTNNLRVAQALADGAPEVYLAGGRVRPIEQAVGGPSALAQFGALWFDAAVIGVSGITAEGFFDYSYEDAEMKRIYFTRASRRIVLADSGKFNRKSLVEVGRLAEATDLVTDAPPPEHLARALAEAGVRLHVAPSHP
jgi:DeoR/GlpR family transcriptional regulator of sugar metabolism